MYYLILAMDERDHPVRVFSAETYQDAKEFTLKLRSVFPNAKLLKVAGEVHIDPMNTDKLQEMLDESSSSL